MGRRDRHTLIFVRESEGQLTGSDCCGKLEGDWARQQGKPVFELQRKHLAAIQPLADAAGRTFGENLDILHVDPRNQIYLFPKLIREAVVRGKFSFRHLQALLMLYRLPAVILDGRLLFSGSLPEAEEFLAALHAHILDE